MFLERIFLKICYFQSSKNLKISIPFNSDILDSTLVFNG